MELREISRLEVIIIIVMSFLITLIRYGSEERYLVVLVTKVILKSATY